MTRATWIKGKQRQTGSWSYNRASDTFTISLDSRDPVTGLHRVFTTHNDRPVWGNWKIVRDPSPAAVMSTSPGDHPSLPDPAFSASSGTDTVRVEDLK